MRITGPEIRQTAGYSPPAAELVAGVFRLVKDRTSDRVGPISARKLSSHLRHDIGPIKRGCDMLEAHGVIRRIRDARSHTLPRYRITPEGNWAARADAQSISDYIQRPLVDGGSIWVVEMRRTSVTASTIIPMSSPSISTTTIRLSRVISRSDRSNRLRRSTTGVIRPRRLITPDT
jgi:hypothetical protein